MEQDTFKTADAKFRSTTETITDAELEVLIAHYGSLRDLFGMVYRPEYVLVENDIRNKLYTLESWKRSRAETGMSY